MVMSLQFNSSEITFHILNLPALRKHLIDWNRLCNINWHTFPERHKLLFSSLSLSVVQNESYTAKLMKLRICLFSSFLFMARGMRPWKPPRLTKSRHFNYFVMITCGSQSARLFHSKCVTFLFLLMLFSSSSGILICCRRFSWEGHCRQLSSTGKPE